MRGIREVWYSLEPTYGLWSSVQVPTVLTWSSFPSLAPTAHHTRPGARKTADPSQPFPKQHQCIVDELSYLDVGRVQEATSKSGRGGIGIPIMN